VARAGPFVRFGDAVDLQIVVEIFLGPHGVRVLPDHAVGKALHCAVLAFEETRQVGPALARLRRVQAVARGAVVTEQLLSLGGIGRRRR
jgi:hypothetical protein